MSRRSNSRRWRPLLPWLSWMGLSCRCTRLRRSGSACTLWFCGQWPRFARTSGSTLSRCFSVFARASTTARLSFPTTRETHDTLTRHSLGAGAELGHHSGVNAAGGCVPASRRGTVGVRCCSSWAVAVMPVCPGPLVAHPQGMTRSIRLALLLLPLACAALPSLARAQTSCPGAASGAVMTTPRQWREPLDRLVTLQNARCRYAMRSTVSRRLHG